MLNPGTGRVQNFGQSSVRRPRHLHTLRTNHIAPLCCTQTVGVEGHREVHAAPPDGVRVPIQGRQIYSNIMIYTHNFGIDLYQFFYAVRTLAMLY